MLRLECPQDWHMVKLSDLGEVNRGRSRHRPRHATFLYGGRYPFIQTGDIKASGGRITSHTQTYSEAGLAQSRLWPVDTMCITIAANIAETAILTYPACFPDSVIGFIANPEKADVRFVELIFRRLRSLIQGMTAESGTVQDNINIDFMERLYFPMPPTIAEQRAMARVLGGLDDKIELNRRMNRTLEDLARGLFRSWFVDFDPVVKGASATAPAAPAGLFPKRLVDSPLGPIPDGWRAGSIADLARYVNGRNFTKNATGTDRMVVRIAELNSGPGGSTVYNDVKADTDNVVTPGDLLFAWSGSLDVYRWHRDEALVNQHIFKVVCEAYPQWFVHFHLCEAMPFFQGIAADKATTMGHIKREHLRQAELALPTDAVLKYASAQIEPIYARLLANERESLRLAATRDALLPQLLSGEIRLTVADRSLAEVH